MSDPGNTEGAAPTAIQTQESSSKWGFLSKIKTAFQGQKSSPEQLKPEAPVAKTNETADDVQRDQLVKTLKEKGVKFGVDNVVKLYPDFIKYLRDPSQVKDPELAKKAEQALNNGDIEVIDVLANIMESKYEDELTQENSNPIEQQLLNKQKVKGLNKEEERLLYEIQINNPGYKRALAKNLVYYMSDMVKQEKGRDSLGGSMDIRLVLSGKVGTNIKNVPTEEEAAVQAAVSLLKQNTPSSTQNS